jgi:SnoaL-like domain
VTVEEMLAREAIRKTMANYNMAGDRLKVDDFIACFTEDAVMESEEAPGDTIFRFVGRDAIHAWQNRWRNREPTQDTIHKASFVRHHISTCKIDLTGPDTAMARTYWVAWTDIGPDHAGYYRDDFRRVGEDWLIAHRRVRRDWQSPDSLFVNAIANSS